MPRLVAVCLIAAACAGVPDSVAGPTASPERALATAPPADTCVDCHVPGGVGIEDAHPFGTAVGCADCHGGDPTGAEPELAHVPPPPGLDPASPEGWFATLTRTGLDKLPDWTDGTRSFTALDYVQFLNPGDARAVAQGRGCGAAGCHDALSTWFSRSVHAQGHGIFSAAVFGAGLPNAVPAAVGLYTDTAADLGFRAVTDPSWVFDPTEIGRVGALLELPERAVYAGETGIFDNPLYDAPTLGASLDPSHRVIDDSPLAHLVTEAIASACGECHAGSAGRNDRYGRFRSSGCSACHTTYAPSGRSASGDPHVDPLEPVDPDQAVPPERPHVQSHRIASVARLIGGTMVSGIPDATCAACHVGSNATALQYWGYRPDPEGDVVNGTQYPANPVLYTTAAASADLFDPAVQNTTYAGLPSDRILEVEDYDGDGRDDTPPDVHAEAGLGCVDCHGGADLHGGASWDDGSGRLLTTSDAGAIRSRMDQEVGVRCETCHGDAEGYAPTTSCVDHDGVPAVCVADAFGTPLRNVTVNGAGQVWLASRVTGTLHYVPQTFDKVVDTGIVHPQTGQPLYDEYASYAMGRADGNDFTGIGPLQSDPALYSVGFSHLDDLACDACHAAWTQTCAGCHLELQYDGDPAGAWFSNVTGERIAVRTVESLAYATPVLATLQVTPEGRIGLAPASTATFFRYVDLNGAVSPALAFSDRREDGNNPGMLGRSVTPALSHGRAAAHSIRGRPTADRESARQCVACHLTVDMMAASGAAYAQFYQDVANGDFGALDYALLAQEIGANPNNQLGSPYYVHLNAGLGAGLLLFDADGCPENPLDIRADRAGCDGVAPATTFDPDEAAFHADRVVEYNGIQNAATDEPLRDPVAVVLRVGAQSPTLSGPLGADLLFQLADPSSTLVLDSWVDADGIAQGYAANRLPPRGTGTGTTEPPDSGTPPDAGDSGVVDEMPPPGPPADPPDGDPPVDTGGGGKGGCGCAAPAGGAGSFGGLLGAAGAALVARVRASRRRDAATRP